MGVAIDSGHLYWAWRPEGSFGAANIGRANIDGTGVQDEFITDGKNFFLAVDSAHIYSVPFGSGYMLRANLDGTGVNPQFATVRGACGLAVDDSHVYWGTLSDTIARANIDGTNVTQSFIASGEHTCGVAVAPDVVPAPGFTLGKVEKNKRHGTAILHADVEVAGKLVLTGEGLRTRIRAPLRPHELGFMVRAKGEKEEVLAKTGSVRVRAKVTFHPFAGGDREVERRAIRLKERGADSGGR